MQSGRGLELCLPDGAYSKPTEVGQRGSSINRGNRIVWYTRIALPSVSLLTNEPRRWDRSNAGVLELEAFSTISIDRHPSRSWLSRLQGFSQAGQFLPVLFWVAVLSAQVKDYMLAAQSPCQAASTLGEVAVRSHKIQKPSVFSLLKPLGRCDVVAHRFRVQSRFRANHHQFIVGANPTLYLFLIGSAVPFH